MSNRPKIFGFLLLLFPCILIGKEKEGTPTFRIPVNVVTIHAKVSDKKGNPVTDLTRDDFKIYEDGKLKEVNTFAQESYISYQEPEQKAAENPGLSRAAKPAKPQVSAPPASTKPRMISLVIDDLTRQSLENLPRLIKSIEEYIKNDVGPSDQVAILSGSTMLQIPFTDDKQRLLEQIPHILGKLNLFGPSISQSCPEITDLQAFQIAYMNNKMEEYKILAQYLTACGKLQISAKKLPPPYASLKDIERAAETQYEQYASRKRDLLDTLRKHMRSLKHFDAKKIVVFFSDGFLAEAADYGTYQIQEIVDLALSSGVVFNCVNTRGLESGMDASKTGDFVVAAELIEAMAEYNIVLPASVSLVQERVNYMLAREAPLEQLARETAGEYFHNDNNLYKGMRQILHRQSQYYILTYATSQKPNGLYHRIKLELSRPGLELSYRQGYFAPKEEMTFEKRKKEDILAALQAPGNLNEIPVSLSYNCYQEEEALYGVSFRMKVGIDNLHFLDENERRKNLISLILVAYDESDKYVDGLEKTIDFKLLEESYGDLRQRGLSSRVELKLPLGRYRIKVVVRESVDGKMGSLVKAIEIP
jgi:VWFA-related protein